MIDAFNSSTRVFHIGGYKYIKLTHRVLHLTQETKSNDLHRLAPISSLGELLALLETFTRSFVTAGSRATSWFCQYLLPFVRHSFRNGI